MKLDLLVIGVHPDDAELGCGGVLVSEKSAGKKTGIIDLTRGELGTRGTADLRTDESAMAAEILNLDVRENLELADGFFDNNESSQRLVIGAIRKYMPEIIICNAPEDRHPDHGRSARLVSDAAFLSGLVKIATIEEGQTQAPWRPKYVLHYIQDRYLKPDFVVDITNVFEQKLESVKAYKTQFFDPEAPGGPQTYISSPEFLESVVSRAAMFGKMIGVKYAEGFISKKMVGIKSFDALIKENT